MERSLAVCNAQEHKAAEKNWDRARGSVLRRCTRHHHHHHGFGVEGAARARPLALLEQWPIFARYALSYLFVGLLWVNHHHLLRYAEDANAEILWSNLALLFSTSLIPFSTFYIAESHVDAFSTALYASIFLLVTLTFSFFQAAITKQAAGDGEFSNMVKCARKRNWIAMGLYTLAVPAAYLHPGVSLTLILLVAVLYFVPDAGMKKRLSS